MKLLAQIFEKDVHPELNTDPDVLLTPSFSARVLLFDDEGKIALMHVVNKKYYVLPGGTLDEGEDYEAALDREVLEEVGCSIEVDGVLGDTVEYRLQKGMKKTCRCFTGRVKEWIQEPQMTEKEICNGARIEWIDPSDLLETVRSSEPIGYTGGFVSPRCVALVEEAEKRGLLDR